MQAFGAVGLAFAVCLLVSASLAQEFSGVVSTWAEASPFGINTHHRPGTEEIESFALAGAQWMRMHYAPWAFVEKERGVYTFPPEYDRFVDAWHEADIQILHILCYGNPLYSGSEDVMVAPVGEEQVRAYADYVRAAVSHYQRWTKHWEIWNEPNGGGFWKPKPDPRAYFELLKAGYEAAKEADPTCFVIGGATSHADCVFLGRLFELGGADYMDAVSIHPYRPRFEASCGSTGYLDELWAVRELVNRYRTGLPVWITEMGWPTTAWQGSGSVTPELQAAYLVRMYALSLAAGIERVFWYHYRDGNQFGLLQWDDFAPKPSYHAYRTMTRVLSGAMCDGLAGAPEGVQAVKFHKHNRDILVCWAPERPQAVTMLGADILRWDMKGRPARAADGPVALTLGPDPIYAAGFSIDLVAL
jgi:hypothetical protein